MIYAKVFIILRNVVFINHLMSERRLTDSSRDLWAWFCSSTGSCLSCTSLICQHLLKRFFSLRSHNDQWSEHTCSSTQFKALCRRPVYISERDHSSGVKVSPGKTKGLKHDSNKCYINQNILPEQRGDSSHHAFPLLVRLHLIQPLSLSFSLSSL